MINETVQAKLIDYLDGNVSAEERKAIERMLAEDADLRAWFEQLKQVNSSINKSTAWKPSTALRESFEAALQQEIRQQESKQIFFTPLMYRAAAAVLLLVVAGAIGFWINNQWQQQREMAELKRQLQETKTMMMAMMNNELSASQRMMGVSVANNLPQADADITNALVGVLNNDPNTNVRLSALEALAKFTNDPAVKRELIQSLATQKDPSVQIALIQLLVQIKAQSIMPQLKDIIEDEQSIKAVRDEAHTAILKLS